MIGRDLGEPGLGDEARDHVPPLGGHSDAAGGVGTARQAASTAHLSHDQSSNFAAQNN